MDRSGPTLLSAASKHKALFITLVVISVIAAVGLSLLSPDSRFWNAEALIILRNPAVSDGTGSTSQRFITENLDIMRSSIVTVAAVGALEESNPEYSVSQDELVLATNIASSVDSALVLLSVVDPNPERAMAMVNAVASAFQELSRLEATRNGVDALSRIDAQLEPLGPRFLAVEAEIEVERNADATLRGLEVQFREALTEILALQALLPDATAEATADLRSRIADYRQRIAIFQEAENTGQASPELQALLQQQQQLFDRQTELLQNRDLISIEVEIASGAVGLLVPAEEATEIVETGTGRILAVALVIGLLVAFGVTYLRELPRGRAFSDRHEPEGVLSAPLLADIPDFSEESLRSRLPVRTDPRSVAAESYRFAARSIEDAMLAGGHKSVMMVGATNGHGKSTCVVNTALADARQGHSILLIDADFGNQDSTRLVLEDGSPVSAGLVEVVNNDLPLQAAVTAVELGSDVSLNLMSRGKLPIIAANLLSRPEAGDVFREAREAYHLVFVDAPPLLQVAYASTLAKHVDALVVVVSHETPVDELEELANRLKLIDTPVLGYLYNRSPLRKEMRTSEGSMVDILGEGGVDPSDETRGSWWQKIGT